MQEEIFKDIPGFEGIYQVSNLGNVKSLPRQRVNGKGLCYTKEKNLKLAINGSGYYLVTLYKEVGKSYRVNQLVAMAFLNHIPCGHKLVVDHINDDKTDNRLENLQIITQRENAYKTQGKYSSKYKGVSWAKNCNKWRVIIYLNGKYKNLGLFKCELKANLVYQQELNKYNNESEK